MKKPCLGLVGKSLKHSFSKDYFKGKFDKLGIKGDYQNFEVSNLDKLKETLPDNIDGFNVTIPFKEDIIPFLDEVDHHASLIGAVNTVLVKDGNWMGYNTDAPGFHNSIKPFLKFGQEKALILGTGGASKAVAFVFEQLGIQVAYLSRSPKNKNEYHYDDVNEIMVDHFKVIVNSTPVGTYPNVEDALNFPIGMVGEDHLVVDLIYNPEKTIFLRKAEAAGADIVNGYPMLMHQAELAWDIWNKAHNFTS